LNKKIRYYFKIFDNNIIKKIKKEVLDIGLHKDQLTKREKNILKMLILF
jgi:hypothetical protein